MNGQIFASSDPTKRGERGVLLEKKNWGRGSPKFGKDINLLIREAE